MNKAKHYCPAPAGSDANLSVYIEVNVGRPLPIENTIKLDDLINEISLDKEMSLLLTQARGSNVQGNNNG